MIDPRPKFSHKIALAVAKDLAAKFAAAGLIDPSQAEESANDIAEHADMHMDGYEIARELEKHCWWECNLQMANALDQFSHLVAHRISAAEEEWAERNQVKPPLPCGAHVSLRTKETGTIEGIYEYGAAKYCIAIDGDPEANSSMHRRRIVNFEDVTAT